MEELERHPDDRWPSRVRYRADRRRLNTICTCRRTRHSTSCPVVMLLAPVLTVAAASVAATNFGSGWQNGICGTTTQFEGRRCRVSEKQGSWVAASRKYCAALCVACPRCHYVSYSKADNDCSWFRTCDFHKSPRGLMAVSLQVRLNHGLVAAGTLATSQRNHTRSSVTRPHRAVARTRSTGRTRPRGPTRERLSSPMARFYFRPTRPCTCVRTASGC